MSGFHSTYWRGALLPVLLLAALLLPTLHLHPIHDHDQHGDSHRHAIIHADFLSVSAHDHHDAEHEDGFEANVSANSSQSGLAALFAGRVQPLRKDLEKGPDFLSVDVASVRPQLVLFARFLKRDYPPPLRQVFLAPNSPRSPPSFA